MGWQDSPIITTPRPAPQASQQPPAWASSAIVSPGPTGSAAGRFVGGVWQNINPVTMAQGLYGAIRHPVDTLTAAAGAMGEQWEDAYTAGSEGRYVEAAGHGLAGTLPFVGPAAAAAGERIGTGDVAGGLGEGVGLLIPTVAPRAVAASARAVRTAAPGAAGALRAGAASKVADVISPKVGANKTRFANNAEVVAPALAIDLAADGAPLTRGGFHTQVQAKLAEAQAGLDAASDARPDRTYPTASIISDLLEKRNQLTAEAVKGVQNPRTPVRRTSSILDESGKPIEVTDQTTRPIGRDVVPGPNAARVAKIDQAIAELKQLGSVATYEPIRRIRQAYDGDAKVVYNPSMTSDFLKQKGSALGAADVTDALRGNLAKWDPETAKVNATYSLYRTANDILKATAEVERARPKVGRRIIARLTGTILGHDAGGVSGAMAGYIAGPIVDSALASGVTTQLKTAALMQRLAKAIEGGDVGRVASITHELKRLGATASAQAGQQRSTTDAAPMPPWLSPVPGTPR